MSQPKPPPTGFMINARGLLALYLLLLTSVSWSQQQIHHSHGLSRFDQLKYSADFSHFDCVNPKAPKGGEIRLFVHGTFDSLNPYATQGITPSQSPTFHYMRYGFNEFNEPLMVGSGQYSPSNDEIKTAYGLIAESVEYPEDNQWIIFNLRPQARFHDGHPVTADDVVFSFQQLRSKGHPRYKMQLEPIESVEKIHHHRVRFTFQKPGTRSQLFRAAELPVLPAHYWLGKSINQTTLSPPLQSGPYRIVEVQPGHAITLERQKDYWGKDLPVNRGRYNFDRVTLYFHRDLQVALESFKAGSHDIHLEIVAKNWENAYDFPAVRNGLIKKEKIPLQMAYGSSIFFFNTRREIFQDVRVRQAL
ncbi:MAG: extracellular solute-binding protein, partial [Endozoicomonas sp.]